MFKGNMEKMLKQAQNMQKNIESVQAELSDTIIDADSGGGMVKIKINGKLEILELNIDSEVLKDKMSSVTGGMLSGLNIPGI
jgi:DNA-binding YbaB/EbfC family protein